MALLETVLALVPFVGAAAVISSGLSASMSAVDRLKGSTHAANLAITVLSEIQVGIRPLSATGGATAFDPPFADWTWEVQLLPSGDSLENALPLEEVEVIVRHQIQPFTHRIKQTIPGWTNQAPALVESGLEGEEPIPEDLLLLP